MLECYLTSKELYNSKTQRDKYKIEMQGCLFDWFLLGGSVFDSQSSFVSLNCGIFFLKALALLLFNL